MGNSSIPTGAQYGSLQKYLSHPSLVVYFFFPNPTHKTERGTANRWELLIANHLDERKEQQSDLIYYTLLSAAGAHHLLWFHQP
jgi:hypothetical protein